MALITAEPLAAIILTGVFLAVFVGVILPAVWSKQDARRMAALTVLRLILVTIGRTAERSFGEVDAMIYPCSSQERLMPDELSDGILRGKASRTPHSSVNAATSMQPDGLSGLK
jgi:hypothetical protein